MVQGTMIWGQAKQGGEYAEPFLAKIQVSAQGEAISYTILCVDATQGLGTMPYGARHRAGHPHPTEWLFTFQKKI